MLQLLRPSIETFVSLGLPGRCWWNGAHVFLLLVDDVAGARVYLLLLGPFDCHTSLRALGVGCGRGTCS